MSSAVQFTRLALLCIACACAEAGCVSDKGPNAGFVASAADDTTMLGRAGGDLTRGRPDRSAVSVIGETPHQSPKGFVDLGRDERSTDPARPTDQVSGAAGGFTLNFVGVDVQDFVRSVFDEVLHENVVVDPTLTGRITVRTSQPVTKAVAQELVQDALKASGASVARDGGVWRVSASAAQTGRLHDTIKVIPLRFINAESARLALQPFNAGGGSDIQIGGSGRFLIVAGRGSDVESLEQVVANLDVDELRGQSFALLPLKEASAAAVAKDVGQMLGGLGGSSTRVFAIDRMNAVMIIASQPGLITKVQAWVTRLDRVGQEQRRIYVAPIRNRRAIELAAVLQGMLNAKSSSTASSSSDAVVAPSLTPQQTAVLPVNGQHPDRLSTAIAQPDASPYGALGVSPASFASHEQIDDSVDVRADPATNSLVIVCRPERYSAVQSAIRALDVLPAQVLIEVTIAEVQLNATLNHGVRWFFQAGHHALGITNVSDTPSLTYAFGVPNAQIALEALENVTHVDIVSSPALTVMDNQTATLKVGDQVPIATRSAQSTTVSDAPIVNDIQLKDTGIILQVTPRVNSSGLVLLDIDQEDSDVVPTTTSSINSPTIRQRKLTSSVAVQSGSEIVLGGIISHGKEHEKTGIPGLVELPVIGSLLASNETLSDKRTELLVILRPTVMANQAEVAAVTSEIRSKMRRLNDQPR